MSKKVDMRQWPYKGVFKTIADRLTDRGRKISPQAVRELYIKKNAEMVRIVEQEIAQRQKQINVGGTHAIS